MLSKLKFFYFILCFITCIDIAYGNKVNRLEDLLKLDISLKDKIEYLDQIKGRGVFSKNDVDVLLNVFLQNAPYIIFEIDEELDEIVEGDEWKQVEDEVVNKGDINEIINMDKIRVSILEILLKKEIDESVLTTSQVIRIAKDLQEEIIRDSYLYNYKRIKYLSLKLLIKISGLNFSSDTAYAVESRENLINGFMNMARNNPSDLAKILESLGIEDVPEELIERLKEETEVSDDKKNIWKERTMIEDCIFDPILLTISDRESDYTYVEDDKAVLHDYEQHLLDNLHLFPRTKHLEDLVVRAFLKTSNLSFRKQYIKAMFPLDMPKALIEIISDKSMDTGLRITAILTSLKLLNHTRSLSFEEFSSELSACMEEISYDFKEERSLRLEAQQAEDIIKEAIESRDEKDGSKKLSISNSGSNTLSSNNPNKGLKRDDLMNFLINDGSSSSHVNVINEAISNDNWKALIPYVDGSIDDIDESIRILAIKASIELLAVTSDYVKFSITFLGVLGRICYDENESPRLKDAAESILSGVARGRFTLKEACKDCALKFMF